MRLVFTKDVGKNFKAGVIKDYPKAVWDNISKSAKKPLDAFTRPIDDFAKQFKGKKK